MATEKKQPSKMRKKQAGKKQAGKEQAGKKQAGKEQAGKKQAGKKPTKERTKERRKMPTKQANKKTTKQPIKKRTKQVTKKTTKKPTKKTTMKRTTKAKTTATRLVKRVKTAVRGAKRKTKVARRIVADKAGAGVQSTTRGSPSAVKASIGAATTKRFQSAESQRRFSRQMCEEGKKIGFVPTMGAFHDGHISLMRKARSQNDVVVVSIFVNPLQFGPGEDFNRYPRDLARDMDQAREVGVDAVFVPDVSEMYPQGFTTEVMVGPMAKRMCGADRLGHFNGVCTVIMKLLGIVQPDRMYLGQKDAQQLVIIQRMIEDLSVNTKVVAVATVREKDGLAMSSRNALLSLEERAQAPRLYEALRLAQREILLEEVRDPRQLQARMRDHILRDEVFRIDYIAMVDPETLVDRSVLTGRTLIALAAHLGQTRLIDNILINVPGGRMAEGIGALGR